MNKKTLANISGIVTKYGRLLNLVQYENGKPSIFGILVKICPSMDNIGASAVLSSSVTEPTGQPDW